MSTFLTCLLTATAVNVLSMILEHAWKARKRARKAVEVAFRVDGYDERGRPFQTIDGIINGKAGSVRVYPMANGRIPNPPISAQPQWDRAPAIQPRFPHA